VRGLGDKQLLREINFPNRVDSLCFINEAGDLLVGHDRRLSVIRFITYWPFRDDKGNFDPGCEVEPRTFPSQEPKKLEIRDQVFINLKRRDEGDREAKRKAAAAAKRAEASSSGEEDDESDREEEEDEGDQKKPPTPMTMRAQAFFDQLKAPYRTEGGYHRKGNSVDAAVMSPPVKEPRHNRVAASHSEGKPRKVHK
jgi:hypothetical protein